jgi:predicted small lipoprotein YifL
MKYLLLVVAIGLSLAGCGEQGPGKSANPGSFTVPPAAKNRSVIKATSERPSTIPAALGPGGACQVDWVNDVLAQKAAPITEKTKVRFVGWAGNTEKGTSPQEVFITLVGPSTVYFKAFSGLKREDIFAAFKKRGMTNSGWEVYADLSEVAAGTYKVQVIQAEGPSASVCDTQRSIVIN